MYLNIDGFECVFNFEVTNGYWYCYATKDNLVGTQDVVYATADCLENCEIEIRKGIEEYYNENLVKS